MKKFDKNMTDKIREVLVSYEAEYSPEAWENFSEKLEPMYSGKQTKRNRWLFGIGGLILVGLVYILFSWYGKVQESKTETNQSIQHIESRKQEEPPGIVNPDSSTSLLPSAVTDKTVPKDKLVKISPLKKTDDHTIQLKEKDKLESSVFMVKDQLRNNKMYQLQSRVLNSLLQKEFGTEDSIEINRKLAQADKIKIRKKKKKNKVSFKIKPPRISLRGTNNKLYKKFLGPNKLAVHWLPEVHYSSKFDKPSVSYGIGIELEGPLSEQLGFAVGVNYQKNKFSESIAAFESLPTRNQSDFNEKELSSLNLSDDSVRIRNTDYQFLELPISLNMYFLQSDYSKFSLSLGMSALFFLKENSSIPFRMLPDNLPYVENKSYGSFDNIHFTGSLNLGLAYQYRLSQRLALNTGFQYKLGLGNLGGLPMKLNRSSFQAGIIYRFGRID